jgi:putative DNA primase/helicase
MPVWAAMSAGGIRNFPVIHGIKRLIIFADNDRAGCAAAATCARRYFRNAVDGQIQIPPEPFCDWNDLVKETE